MYVTRQVYMDSKYFMSDNADVVGFDNIVDAVNNIVMPYSRGVSTLKDIEILYAHMKNLLKRNNNFPPIIYTNDVRFKKFSKYISINPLIVYKKEFKTSYLCYNGISPSTDCAILYCNNKWIINPLVKNMATEIFFENSY